MIIGIDPGLTGGMVLYNDTLLEVEDYLKFSKLGSIFNVNEMVETIKNWRHGAIIKMVVIEQVSSRPMQGVASVFKFGMTYGMQIGVISTNKLPLTFINPTRWTKEIHQGIKTTLDPKEKSQVAMSQLFPTVDWKGPRSGKQHEGLMDALLIAEFWRRSVLRSSPEVEKTKEK